MSITESKSNIDRILEVHTDYRDVHARMLLVHKYKVVTRDPSYDGDHDNLQLQLTNYVDVLCRMTEDEFRNELARLEERLELPWNEIEEQLAEVMEDD
jgi:hypothetical protein